MKRYVYAADESRDEELAAAQAIVDQVMAKFDSEIEWDPDDGDRGYLSKYRGEKLPFPPPHLTVKGYTAPIEYFFLLAYHPAVGAKETAINYIQEVDNAKAKLNDIVGRIPEATKIVKQLIGRIHEYYAASYNGISVDAKMNYYLTASSGFVYNFDVRSYSSLDNSYPQFKITAVIDNKSISEVVTWNQLTQGTAFDNVISSINKQVKRSSRSSSGNKLLVDILKEHGIDTTKAQYELKAESYERYDSGKVYTRKFTCPGDYLAYFAMWVHRQPSVSSIDDLDYFEDIVDENPTVGDIATYAEQNWWGDGDDYIIYLKNLNTGEILYSADEPEEEYEEEEWED